MIGCLAAQSFHEDVEDVAILLQVVIVVSDFALPIATHSVGSVTVFQHGLCILNDHQDGAKRLM